MVLSRFRPHLQITCLATALLAGASSVAAQNRGGSQIVGVVLDAQSRRPIAQARVTLVGTRTERLTDDRGHFSIPNLADGPYAVRVVVPGVDSTTTQVRLAQNERVSLEVYVGATLGTVLPEVVVTSAAGSGSGRVDFERRLAEGNGRFITREYIERRKPQDLMDLMRGVAGVRVECATDRYRCAMQFGRSPRGCSPQYYMDGMRTHPSIFYMTLPTDVVGIELYSGAAQVPPEFQGQSSRCGVVAIWTHNGRGIRQQY